MGWCERDYLFILLVTENNIASSVAIKIVKVTEPYAARNWRTFDLLALEFGPDVEAWD